MSHGYAVSNVLTGLADTSFTWSSGYTTSRGRLNDGIQDELASGSSSAQASGQTLAIDLGSASALVGFALLNHNLASGSCTVKVEGADNAGFSTNLVTAKAATTIVTTAPNEKDTALQFPSATKRYWRLTFAHSGTKTVALGELMALSSITTLSRAAAYGMGEEERYILNQNESRTGNQRSTFLAGPIRTKTFNFKDCVGTSQRDELMTMFRATRGGNTNLLWIDTIDSSASAGSAASQECLWGRLEQTLGWTQPDYALFEVNGLTLTGQGREVGS